MTRPFPTLCHQVASFISAFLVLKGLTHFSRAASWASKLKLPRVLIRSNQPPFLTWWPGLAGRPD